MLPSNGDQAPHACPPRSPSHWLLWGVCLLFSCPMKPTACNARGCAPYEINHPLSLMWPPAKHPGLGFTPSSLLGATFRRGQLLGLWGGGVVCGWIVSWDEDVHLLRDTNDNQRTHELNISDMPLGGSYGSGHAYRSSGTPLTIYRTWGCNAFLQCHHLPGPVSSVRGVDVHFESIRYI